MKIDCSKCAHCHSCLAVCPMGAIQPAPDNPSTLAIDTTKCVNCGQCASVCPMGAISK